MRKMFAFVTALALAIVALPATAAAMLVDPGGVHETNSQQNVSTLHLGRGATIAPAGANSTDLSIPLSALGDRPADGAAF